MTRLSIQRMCVGENKGILLLHEFSYVVEYFRVCFTVAHYTVIAVSFSDENGLKSVK